MTASIWPQWTEELTTRFITGEDHLGIESAAQNYQLKLVPGIISTTDHARYYSFYAWILHRFIRASSSSRLMRDFRGPYFKRHEVALIAASYAHHQQETVPGLIGARSAGSVWESGDPIDLDVTYFQNSLGGLGQYYRPAMQIMGILGEQKDAKHVYTLTPRGKALAEAYEASLNGTRYLDLLNDRDILRLDGLRRDVAAEYGARGCICAEALANGHDRALLLDTFFRFEDRQRDTPHYNRRLTLGVVLDMVYQADRSFQRDAVRSILYTGEYEPNHYYQPSQPLAHWVARWRTVGARHMYAFALQALWGAFILVLQDQHSGLPFEAYQAWMRENLPSAFYDMKLSDYLDDLCESVGLAADWSAAYPDFDDACNLALGQDELTFAEYTASERERDAAGLLEGGVQILAQFFLRHLERHYNQKDTWTELANEQRLPMNSFLAEMEQRLSEPDLTVSGWLDWIYREYILGQHEAIALEKLRYNGYDTFKFYYRDGRFYWPPTAGTYRQPIRFSGLRLQQVFDILVDLGLVAEQGDGYFSLTSEGLDYLERTLRSV